MNTTIHAKSDLKEAHDQAELHYEHTKERVAHLDKILAAMKVIDDAPADCDALTEEDLAALDKADNAQACAELTAVRSKLDAEVTRLDELVRAAWRAYDAEPEDIN